MSISFKKTTTKLVALFIIGLILLFAKEANSETIISVAPVTQWVGGHKVEGSTLKLVENIADKYEFGIILSDIGGQVNGGVQAQRVVGKKFQMGIGVTYWKNQTIAWNSQFTFALSLRWNINDNWLIEHSHWSTAGSSTRNSGLDMLMVGYRFGGRK